MKIISWNVNGIRACANKGLFEFIKSQNADVTCLQETKAHPGQLDLSFTSDNPFKNYWSTSAKKKGYSGTVNYCKPGSEPISVEHGIGIRQYDLEGRFVVADHGDFLLYNVYFPNGSASDDRHFFKQDFLRDFTFHLKNKIKEGREIIVVGDYNVAYMEQDVYDPKRLSKVSGFLPEEREWFNEFLGAGFVDICRKFYPEDSGLYTWWSYREGARQKNNGWRIDFICATKKLAKKMTSFEILKDQHGSDHCPVVAEF